MDLSKSSKEFVDGYFACKLLDESRSNPHSTGTKEWSEWEAGFAAKKASLPSLDFESRDRTQPMQDTQYDPIAELQAKLNQAVAAKDKAYSERNQCVALIAKLAAQQGYAVGMGKHDPQDYNWEDDWRNIVYIDLPTGQVSWHIHDSELPLFDGVSAYKQGWDGHSTYEKHQRMQAYVLYIGEAN